MWPPQRPETIGAMALWGLYAIWPFSRLVHAWSVPVAYLHRSPVLYRARTRVPERSRHAHV